MAPPVRALGVAVHGPTRCGPARWLIFAAGTVDVQTATELRLAVHATLALVPAGHTAVIDVSGLELRDATGLGVLLGAHRRALRQGQELVLRRVQPPLARLLEVTRLTRVLAVEDDSAA